MTTIPLAELRALLEKAATPRPWIADYTNLYSEDDYSDLMTSSCCCGNGLMREHTDASLIATAINNLPALIAAAEERDALKAKVERYEKALQFYADGPYVERYINGVRHNAVIMADRGHIARKALAP